MMSEQSSEPRVEYNELRGWVFEGLYNDQRSCIKNGQTFNRIMSLHSIADSYDGVFEREIENLMLSVFLTILGSDCEKAMTKHWFDRIKIVLEQNNLSSLLAELSEEEKFELLTDLKALGLEPIV